MVTPEPLGDVVLEGRKEGGNSVMSRRADVPQGPGRVTSHPSVVVLGGRSEGVDRDRGSRLPKAALVA